MKPYDPEPCGLVELEVHGQHDVGPDPAEGTHRHPVSLRGFSCLR
jgi:hypothetical protein